MSTLAPTTWIAPHTLHLIAHATWARRECEEMRAASQGALERQRRRGGGQFGQVAQGACFRARASARKGSRASGAGRSLRRDAGDAPAGRKGRSPSRPRPSRAAPGGRGTRARSDARRGRCEAGRCGDAGEDWARRERSPRRRANSERASGPRVCSPRGSVQGHVAGDPRRANPNRGSGAAGGRLKDGGP